MKTARIERIRLAAPAAAVLTAAMAMATVTAPARAQNSGLFDDSQPQRPLTLDRCSWTYEQPRPQKPVGLHDLITVLVDESSIVLSEGEMYRIKKAQGDLILSDWILLDWLSVFPDPQSRGDPRIAGKLDNKMRSQAELETRDTMKFRITCAVVDIRPNGNLVIEGHDTILFNREEWDCSFTGEIRAGDILPTNTVLSENVANKRIHKWEHGHVRDGYRRGWLLRILDKWQPF